MARGHGRRWRFEESRCGEGQRVGADAKAPMIRRFPSTRRTLKFNLEFPDFLVNPVVNERLVPPWRDEDPSLHFVQGRLRDEQAPS